MIDELIQSRKSLVQGLPQTVQQGVEAEGGCGVTGFACSIPVRGRHIFEPSRQMHNRGNGRGGGIAAMGFDPHMLGVSEEILKEDYLLQIAVLEEVVQYYKLDNFKAHIHGSPDGPWFFIIARNDTQAEQLQLIGISDTAMLRPQVFALHESQVQVGLICSEKQAIDATLKSLSNEDPRVGDVADKCWNARGGSHTDGGAFMFNLDQAEGAPLERKLSCTDKFGHEITAPKDQTPYLPGRVYYLVESDEPARFDNDISDFFTVIEISFPPRVGLAYETAKQISLLELNIRFAKVNSDTERRGRYILFCPCVLPHARHPVSGHRGHRSRHRISLCDRSGQSHCRAVSSGKKWESGVENHSQFLYVGRSGC